MKVPAESSGPRDILKEVRKCGQKLKSKNDKLWFNREVCVPDFLVKNKDFLVASQCARPINSQAHKPPIKSQCPFDTLVFVGINQTRCNMLISDIQASSSFYNL